MLGNSNDETRIWLWAVAVLLFLPVQGCITHPANPAATQPVTHIDPEQATSDYWLTQPAIASVSGRDFYRLWNACRAEVHDRFFLIDREEFREGTLSTAPMISKMYFEIWRRDAVTPDEIAQSSLASIRRSVWIELKKQPDGTFIAQPKVLVERYASAERRLTNIYEYHAAFSGPRVTGSSEADQGQIIPADYWYSIGRDAPLEKDLAAAIQRRLGN